MTMLTKSLQILPEKFHGLTDTDTRYRQRYVDLIMNQDSKNVFIKRSQILKEIRNFLADRDFMEVETPMLVANAGGAAARPFETHYNALNEDVKLRISLELHLCGLLPHLLRQQEHPVLLNALSGQSMKKRAKKN